MRNCHSANSLISDSSAAPIMIAADVARQFLSEIGGVELQPNRQAALSASSGFRVAGLIAQNRRGLRRSGV